MAFFSQNMLPVIDMSVTTPGEVTRALEQYGCFIAIYDQVSEEMHDATFATLKGVFDLPVEVKALNTVEAWAYGYIGLPPKAPVSERISIEDGSTEQGVENFTKFMWPSGNESFRASALTFSKAASKLEEMVMRMVAKNYGIEQEYEMLLGARTHVLNINKYGCPKENESNMRLFAHTDKTLITIIQQEVQGKDLEIETKNGEWIQVDLSPTSFVVMAGDVFTAWSNGRIEASFHRVMNHGNRERYSLVLSSLIRDLMVEVPQALVDENHPLQYEAFDHCKYIQYHTRNNKITDGRRANWIKSYCGISTS